MMLKTRMNDRGLPVTKWERRTHLQGVLVYFRIRYKPEPVTHHQSPGNEYGHIYTPFGSGGGNDREGKSSCGLTPQTARPPEGYSSSKAACSSARGTRCCLRGDTLLKICISTLFVSGLSLTGHFCIQSVPRGHFVRTPELHVFHTLHLQDAGELREAWCCLSPGQAHSLPSQQPEKEWFENLLCYLKNVLKLYAVLQEQFSNTI